MENADTLTQILPALIPLLIIEVVLWVIALRDLSKRKQVLGGNKLLWALIIIFIQIIGAVLYLIIGRKETPIDGD